MKQAAIATGARQAVGRVIEGERHAGVLPEFYNRGLRFLFSPE